MRACMHTQGRSDRVGPLGTDTRVAWLAGWVAGWRDGAEVNFVSNIVYTCQGHVHMDGGCARKEGGVDGTLGNPCMDFTGALDEREGSYRAFSTAERLIARREVQWCPPAVCRRASWSTKLWPWP